MKKSYAVVELTAEVKPNTAIYNGITGDLDSNYNEQAEFDTYEEAEAFAKTFNACAEPRQESNQEYLLINEVYVGAKTFDEDGEVEDTEMMLIQGCC